QPIAAAMARHATEREADNEAPLRAYACRDHAPAHVPHQQVGIEVLIGEQIVPDPALRPVAHTLHDREQLAAALREVVFDAAALRQTTLDDPRVLQLLQPTREK